MRKLTSKIVHVQIGPKSVIYIPNDWVVWDTIHSDWSGIRWSFPGKVDVHLKELRKLPLGDPTCDHEKMLMEWDKFRVGSQAPAPGATPRPEVDASASSDGVNPS